MERLHPFSQVGWPTRLVRHVGREVDHVGVTFVGDDGLRRIGYGKRWSVDPPSARNRTEVQLPGLAVTLRPVVGYQALPGSARIGYLAATMEQQGMPDK